MKHPILLSLPISSVNREAEVLWTVVYIVEKVAMESSIR